MGSHCFFLGFRDFANVDLTEDGEVGTRKAAPLDPSLPFEAIASTEVEARDGNVVELSSLRLNTAAGKSGWVPLLADHDARTQVGKVRLRRYKPEDGGPMQLRMTVQLFEADTSEKVREIRRIYEQDPDRGFSISWRGGEWVDRSSLPETDPMHRKKAKRKSPWGDYEQASYLIRGADLLEVSTTPIPSDTTARPVRSSGEEAADVAERVLAALEARPDLIDGLRRALAIAEIRALGTPPEGGADQETDAQGLTGQDGRGSVDDSGDGWGSSFFGAEGIPSNFWE